MDNRSPSSAKRQRAVNLRRGRATVIEILDCAAYDFVLSLHVTLAASSAELNEYDIGSSWVTDARARCAAYDPQALDMLGHYMGDERPTSLQATLISLIDQCPAPRTSMGFLDWLKSAPADDFAEALLDQEGLSANWSSLLRQALAERAAAPLDVPGPLARRLLDEYPREAQPSVQRVLMDVEGARAEVIGALRVWYEAVFAAEELQISATLKREAEAMMRRRAETTPEEFIEREMRGVQWQQPAGVRRYIFAPSVFCRPAVYLHFWRGALTFCTPIDPVQSGGGRPDVDVKAPDVEIVRFFQALGDDTRLRILRLLTEREMYLTELSENLRLTKATTKHHMVRLRAAGLVTLHVREHMTFYSLRAGTLFHATEALERYLNFAP